MEPISHSSPRFQTKSVGSKNKSKATAVTRRVNLAQDVPLSQAKIDGSHDAIKNDVIRFVTQQREFEEIEDRLFEEFRNKRIENSQQNLALNKNTDKNRKVKRTEQEFANSRNDVAVVGGGHALNNGLQNKITSAGGNGNDDESEITKNKMVKSGLEKRKKNLKEKSLFKNNLGSNLNTVLNHSKTEATKEQPFQELEKSVSSIDREVCLEVGSTTEDQSVSEQNSSPCLSSKSTSRKKNKKNGPKSIEKEMAAKCTSVLSQKLPQNQIQEKLMFGCRSKNSNPSKFKPDSSPKKSNSKHLSASSHDSDDDNSELKEFDDDDDNEEEEEEEEDDDEMGSFEIEKSNKVLDEGKKSKEVSGSYSQLLQSINEPLFYRPAEEIASLLSPMACKGGPNQRNFSGWKNNANNFSHNRQNQRSSFPQNLVPEVKKNFGHCSQNQSPVSPNAHHQNSNTKNNNKQNFNENFLPFEDYWPIEQQSFQNPNLIVGQIRVNPKDYQECYVPHPDGHSDVFVCGMKNRNRALNGDIVVVLLDNQSKWRVNKEEFDSDFNADCNDCQSSDPNLPSPIDPTQQQLSQHPADNPKQGKEEASSTSNPDLSAQFKTLNLYTTKTQTSITNETSNNTNALNAVDPNIKKQPKKKENQNKKYTCIADLDNDDNLQKVLANKSGLNLSHKYIQRTGKVVAISEKKHSRLCVGHLQLMNNKKVKFNPTDSRLPRVLIPISECPKEFLHRPETFSKVLFVAKIKDWGTNDAFASGNLLKRIGDAGQIDAETEGILIENDIDFSEFPEQSLKSLPLNMGEPWTIPRKEYDKRRDFTKTCVFTIDPESARDLDDAVSCEKLENGLYEIGVHIADVTYFLKENTQLDKIAASRATSVYLVQKVIPMLPRVLCEQLCSLNPGEPRLTFSVVWKMNDKAEIVNEWFGRSVISSCAKLSYTHAQGFIDHPNREFTDEQLPKIYGFNKKDIKERILTLHKIAAILRKNRFDAGALRLDQVKLQWVLNEETGQPTGTSVYEQKDSNRLIEEFMLLANMAVAHCIYKTFPNKSFLRRHPEPQTKMIENLNDLCENLNIPIDISSAGAINRSLKKYLNIKNDDEYVAARMQVLVAMCSKPMKLAVYFCTGILKDESKFWHYALNVPLYTHFTSPIRRYPDVIVHRLLGAALDYHPLTQSSMEEMEKQAQHCNDKKSNSKRAQELSNEIFFAAFVKAVGPLHEKGMVMTVLDHAFDVFILKYGIVKRVYCNKLNLVNHVASKKRKIPILTLHWKKTGKGGGNERKDGLMQEICVFTLVNCILEKDTEPLRWTAVIKPPKL